MRSRVTAAKAWYITALLCLLFIMSMLDRLIVALLAQPLANELALSDTQLGALIGLNFGVLYALVGLPLAHMIDRGNRIRWLCAGVVLWSSTTILSAFANSFAELAICRAGVAIGEAVLSPAAISIIGDIFPREKRAVPTVVFMAVSTVMTTGAFVLGGWTFDLAGGMAPDMGLSAWRITMIFVGFPGLVIVLLLALTVREPPRTDVAETQSYASARDAVRFLLGERRLYGFVFMGMAAFTISGVAFGSWTPTILVRKFGVSTSEAGYMFGAFGAGLGILGTLVWPALVARWMRRGRPEALLTIMAYTLAGAVAAVAIFGFVPTLGWAMFAIGLFYFAGTTATFLPSLIIQSAAPGEMRGRLIACNLIATNMIGWGIGPAAAAIIADRAFDGPGALGSAFIVLAAITGPLAFVSFRLARQPYGSAYRAALSSADPRPPK